MTIEDEILLGRFLEYLDDNGMLDTRVFGEDGATHNEIIEDFEQECR